MSEDVLLDWARNRPKPRDEQVERHGDGGPHLGEVQAELPLDEERVDRRGDRAGTQGAHHGDHEGRAGGQVDADSITVGHAHLAEHVREAVGCPVELAE